MKWENIYVKVCAALLLTVFLWGFVAPQLISSPTDAGLVAGVLVVLAVPVFVFWIAKSIIKQLKTKNENEKN